VGAGEGEDSTVIVTVYVPILELILSGVSTSR